MSAQWRLSCREEMPASRTSGFPQFCLRSGFLHSDKIGSPTRRLRRSLPRSSTPTCLPALPSRLSRTQGDETMNIEQHIEELRAELRNACDADERAQVEAELQLAQADLAVALAEQDGTIEPEPPF
ncbi:hypothetical protein B5E41_20890 [Rhizobium esperanzae]|uniref:Uncharacterized protein n=2 Tax=Rhizobium esperanzae TaxID=1967781 RepID=A0A246DRI9_9HYPH|nr:hypothetical protein B5E41_20890 [Rhizobium esperanzae]